MISNTFIFRNADHSNECISSSYNVDKRLTTNDPNTNVPERTTETYLNLTTSNHVQPSPTHLSTQKQRKLQNKEITGNERGGNEKREIRMIKIASYITILYLISCMTPLLNTFIPSNSFLITYITFLNNCCNPWIYFVADKAFRKEVLKMLERVRVC